MGDVEPGAQGVGHAVVEAQAGVGEGDARQAGGIVHPLPGLAVLGVLIGGQQVALDQLDGLFRRRVGEVGGLGGHKGLHRMGEHVDAGVRRHGRGHAGGQLRVQNGDVGQQAVLHQGIFDPLLLVGDHRKAAHLRAGAAGGGDGDELAVPHVPLPGGEEHDCLGRVDGGAAAEGHHRIGLELQNLLHASGDGGDVRVGLHVGEDLELAAVAQQPVGDIIRFAALGHELVRHQKDPVQPLGQRVHATSDHNFCTNTEGVHMLLLSAGRNTKSVLNRCSGRCIASKSPAASSQHGQSHFTPWRSPLSSLFFRQGSIFFDRQTAG